MNQVNNLDKLRKTDVRIELKPIDGKKPLSTQGLVDTRLFTGDNYLRAIQDPQTRLWHLEYDKGITPPVFHQQFTSYHKVLDFVKTYMKKRNIEIANVID